MEHSYRLMKHLASVTLSRCPDPNLLKQNNDQHLSGSWLWECHHFFPWFGDACGAKSRSTAPGYTAKAVGLPDCEVECGWIFTQSPCLALEIQGSVLTLRSATSFVQVMCPSECGT